MSDWGPTGGGGGDDAWGGGTSTNWKEDVSDIAGPVSNGFDTADDGFGATSNDISGGFGGGGCRNCGQDGHFAKECPEPKVMTGECYNCGETGHNKADCPNPKVDRPFTGTCRLCDTEGHRAADCPQKAPDICRNCGQEGHKAAECSGNRVLNYDLVPDVTTEEAWNKLVVASKERDIDDFKDALKMYCKQNREITYEQLEHKFREAGFTVYMVALESELPLSMTNVNLQGKSGCKYIANFYFSTKPKRAINAAKFPSSTEENMERLKDCGVPMDEIKPLCRNCNELGHISKNCPQDKIEKPRAQILCYNCNEVGHRQRDCLQPRQVHGACKNCDQPGHKAADCPEPRSAANVECRKCGEMGHFSKECPNGGAGGGDGCRNCGEVGHIAKECDKPKNPATVTCRNCDTMGHFSRDCPEPKDWSRVKCQNCGEMGHTIRRCKAPGGELGPPRSDDGFGVQETIDALNDTTIGGNDWNSGATNNGGW